MAEARSRRLVLAWVVLLVLALIFTEPRHFVIRNLTCVLVLSGGVISLHRVLREGRALFHDIQQKYKVFEQALRSAAWLIPTTWMPILSTGKALTTALARPVAHAGCFALAATVEANTPAVNNYTRTFLLSDPGVFCAGPENRKLVLFVHGWRGDPEGTWRRFPELTCIDPRLRDADVWFLDYPTFLLERNLHLTQLAHWLNRRLEAREVRKYTKIVVLAHSMGGLISRKMVILSRLSEAALPLELLVEVATPHQGANYATLGAIIGISRPLSAEMEKGSTFLADLETEWNQLPVMSRPRTTCYASQRDEVVPETSATHQCDTSVTHPQWDHRELVKPESLDDPRYSLPVFEILEYMRK